MNTVKAYAKYLAKGLFAAGGAVATLGIALSDLSPGGNSVTTAEWYGIVIAGLVTAGVIVSKNGPKPE